MRWGRYLLIALFSVCSTVLFAQFATLDNNSGDWANAANWVGSNDPTMPFNTGGGTIDIYGYITSNSPIIMKKGTLSVSDGDTLVINGDLEIQSNANFSVGNYSVVIVYGNATMGNQTDIAANGYFIVTGNLTFSGSYNQGSFTSDLIPAQVYVGGTVTFPSGTPDYSAFPVLECGTGDHANTDCSYGDFVDIEGSPINDFVNGGCSPKPNITSITSNSPVFEGNSISLSANGDPGSGGTWPLTYIWSGPASYSATGTPATRSSVTSDMTGYYVLALKNVEGCKSYDSVYVDVPSSTCCNGMSSGWVSKDNHTGLWSDAGSWATPNDPWRPIPPPTDPHGGQDLCINGYVTLDGDLNITGSNQRICDTLVITGNLTLTSHSLEVTSTGILIVLGNFDGVGGSFTNNGNVVAVGNFSEPSSYSITNNNEFYVFDSSPLIEGFTPTGNEDSLQANNSDLYNFVNTLIGGGCAVSINGSLTNVTCYNGADGAIDITVSGASAPVSYSWDNSATSEDLSGLSAGTYKVVITDNNACQDSGSYTLTQPPAISVDIGTDSTICEGATITFDAGSGYSSYTWSTGETTQTMVYTGPTPAGASVSDTTTVNVVVVDGTGCSGTSNSVDIISLRSPVTGPAHHVSNNFSN